MPQSFLKAIVDKITAPKRPMPHFYDTIDVHAPLPNYNEPVPENLDEIVFGSRTQRPSGTFINPNRQTDRIGPTLKRSIGFNRPSTSDLRQQQLNDIYQQFLNKYPYARFLPRGIFPAELDKDVSGAYSPENDITLFNSNLPDMPWDEIITSLGHELTHNAQRINFPDLASYSKSRFNMPYVYNPEEIQAEKAGRLAAKKWK